MKILVALPDGRTRDTFFTKRARAEIERLGEVIYNPFDRQFTPDEFRDCLEDIDILMTGWGTPLIDERVLEKADKLRLVAHAGGTLAGYMTDAVYEKAEHVLSGNIVFAESVAEGCIAYIMCALRRMEKGMGLMRSGSWKYDEIFDEGILGRSVGLVGFGMTAKFLAKMLEPFRVSLKICSGHLKQEEADLYNAKLASLNEVFETCDIVSIHLAKTPKTLRLIGREQIKKMKDGALLLNTARGEIIDEAALVEELRTGRIHAALDVYAEEPPPADAEIRRLPNVMLMPHVGGPTMDQREQVVLTLAEDILKFINGEVVLKTAISAQYATYMTQDRLKVKVG